MNMDYLVIIVSLLAVLGILYAAMAITESMLSYNAALSALCSGEPAVSYAEANDIITLLVAE